MWKDEDGKIMGAVLHYVDDCLFAGSPGFMDSIWPQVTDRFVMGSSSILGSDSHSASSEFLGKRIQVTEEHFVSRSAEGYA